MLIIKRKSADSAKETREYLRSVLETKYELTSKIDENAFRYYQGGTSPTDSDCFGFSLGIRKDVTEKRGGYVIVLDYGEYDYVNESL